MSLTITTKISGSQPGRRFEWMVAAVEWADTVGPLVRTAMKTEAPIGKGPRAGRLRGAIRYSRTASAARVTAQFKAFTPYAGFVITGTRAGAIITPKAARALHWSDGDGEHFSLRVRRGATRANNFPKRAMDRTRPAVQAAHRDIMRRRLGGT